MRWTTPLQSGAIPALGWLRSPRNDKVQAAMPPKTAFVTGGAVLLGLNLIERLSARHRRIFAHHRPTSDLSQIRSFPVQLVEGDLLNPTSLRKAFPPDVAAEISVWSRNIARQTRVNVKGTRNVFEAARGRGETPTL